jgi:hypothetical protein
MAPLTVKLAFVLDCTASMGPWIRAAKTKIREIVDTVTAEHLDSVIKVGLMGYRDYDDSVRFIPVEFTTPEEVMVALRPVTAEGGDDRAEDVAHALKHVMAMSWDSADIRMVFHIADAPAHGLAFHRPSLSDRFPNGDPEGVDPRDFIRIMSDQAFVYTFVKITTSTDTMLDAFHNAWTGPGVFQVIDLRPQDPDHDTSNMLSPAVSRAVTQAIDRYTLSQDT